jgi:hypothetical protein
MSNVTKFIDNRQYHKANYSDVMKYIIPSLYYEADFELNEKEVDIIDQVINSHLVAIGNFSSIISISSVAGAFSSLNKASGIAQFFVKQNSLTDIDTNDFERKILLPLGMSFRDFNSSSDFSDFLKDTLLPGIRLNNPTLDFLDGGSKASNHTYLINNLSWFYFLNLSGPPSLTYNSSSFVHDILVEKIYTGQTLSTNDGIRGLTNYIWRNYTTQSWSSLAVLPNEFKPSAGNTSSIYTSGTQQLDKLCTLVDIAYSPLYIDDGDFRVRDAVENYLQNSYLLTELKHNGPFLRLLKAFSFAFADYSNQIDRLESLYDLDECPDQYLPLLADLIGWKLFGSEPDRWRLQLANAVEIYKTVGTKKCVQLVADSVFGEDVFNASSTITELWESYIPFLIQYALATESTLLRSFETWTRQSSQDLGVANFSSSSMDENIKLCVDKIIKDTVYQFSSNFLLGNEPFKLGTEDFIFNYRGTLNPVPPFEEIPYYTKVRVTSEMVDFIADKLICFQVPESFALQVANYIKSKVSNQSSDFNVRSSWLFFTSGIEYAPNWNSVIADITNTRSDYLPLWNGKSSFFRINLDTSGFDFGKTSLEADSKEVLYITSQSIKKFSPAKAVPDVLARSSYIDAYPVIPDSRFPTVSIPKADYAQVNKKYNLIENFGIPEVYTGPGTESLRSNLFSVEVLNIATYVNAYVYSATARFGENGVSGARAAFSLESNTGRYKNRLWYRNDKPVISYTTFGASSVSKVRVSKIGSSISSIDIRPRSKNFNPKIINGVLEMQMSPKDKAWVTINGDVSNTLFVFCDPYKPEIPANNRLYFPPGVHHVSALSGAVEISATSGTRTEIFRGASFSAFNFYQYTSGTPYTIYLDGGAYVIGQFDLRKKHNIKVIGPGILAGDNVVEQCTRFENDSFNTEMQPYGILSQLRAVTYAYQEQGLNTYEEAPSGMVVSGPTIVNCHFVTMPGINVIDNVKVLSPFMPNVDIKAPMPDNSTSAAIMRDSLFFMGDDAIVPNPYNAYPTNPNTGYLNVGGKFDISGCQVYTTNGGPLVLSYFGVLYPSSSPNAFPYNVYDMDFGIYTYKEGGAGRNGIPFTSETGEVAIRITLDMSSSFSGSWPNGVPRFGINNVTVSNIRFDDPIDQALLWVGNVPDPYFPTPLPFRGDEHGSMSGITFKNISVNSYVGFASSLYSNLLFAKNSTNRPKNLIFENIKLNGTVLTNSNYLDYFVLSGLSGSAPNLVDDNIVFRSVTESFKELGLAGFAVSALAMSTYKRGITEASVDTFSRKSVDSIVDTLLNPTGATAILPRRSHRRRDLKHILPREGYYDRSGFNSPSPMHNYITSGPLVGNYLPLGLIPSSMQFVPINDYNSIPTIYSKCEDLSSSNTYNGVPVSNTFPIRGWVPK